MSPHRTELRDIIFPHDRQSASELRPSFWLILGVCLCAALFSIFANLLLFAQVQELKAIVLMQGSVNSRSARSYGSPPWPPIELAPPYEGPSVGNVPSLSDAPRP